jgi:hypothetical protein
MPHRVGSAPVPGLTGNAGKAAAEIGRRSASPGIGAARRQGFVERQVAADGEQLGMGRAIAAAPRRFG